MYNGRTGVRDYATYIRTTAAMQTTCARIYNIENCNTSTDGRREKNYTRYMNNTTPVPPRSPVEGRNKFLRYIAVDKFPQTYMWCTTMSV